ncbi:hypothetical protein ABH930_000343 [Kitasatospora sp. GAS204A]|uniref:hypothetical protein n=1 Tax=unclassified Kitasatospora TaxID=2633591 RepID=UPI002474AA0E|nr:hypothetical protein [Kitasatospora sp. GAS204B]MDH6116924.1 hypothetical protein [Kitasatospora sp. GAS204B]
MANAAPIEAKVRASALTAALLGVVITGLNSVGANSSLLAPLPQWAQSIVTLLAPPLAVLLAGWAAPHSPRSASVATAPVAAVSDAAQAPLAVAPPVAVVPAAAPVQPAVPDSPAPGLASGA